MKNTAEIAQFTLKVVEAATRSTMRGVWGIDPDLMFFEPHEIATLRAHLAGALAVTKNPIPPDELFEEAIETGILVALGLMKGLADDDPELVQMFQSYGADK